LVWLGDVRVDCVNFLDDTPVSGRKSSILENWSHIRPVAATVVDQISKRSLGEFYTVDPSSLSNNVTYMTGGSAAGRTEVEDFVPVADRNFG